MNFSIVGIIRRLLAPRHELSISPVLWRGLCASLRERGEKRSRESGAFLLGRLEAGAPRILDYVLYDDLDPNCLKTGIVRFDGRYFGALWDVCQQRGLNVVADVHVHPGRSDQSASDQNHPMISQAGPHRAHLAALCRRSCFASGGGNLSLSRRQEMDPRCAGARTKFLRIGF